MENKTLILGSLGERKVEGVWLFLTIHDGQYVYWGQDENEEYRELLEIPEDQDLPQVKVRRFNHPGRNQYIRKAMSKYRKLGNVPDELQQKIIREAVSHTVLVDWKNIALDDSGPQPYSPDIGAEAFKADPDFYEAVVAAAMEESYHREQAIAEDAEALGN